MLLKQQLKIIKIKGNALSISISDTAANRITDFISNRGDTLGVRLGVRTTGCSGLAYVVEFVDELNIGDEVFDTNGIKIVVDLKSLTYLDGTQLDYTKEGLNEGFKFVNPNVKDECGCGESFTV
jgi:iron-sulfur cluster assembly protein